jgi:hypothetical protein
MPEVRLAERAHLANQECAGFDSRRRFDSTLQVPQLWQLLSPLAPPVNSSF